MLETPHVIVGAVIASKITNPILSLPLAFGSHFLLDMAPHWNPHLNTEIKTYGKITSNTKAFVAVDAVLSIVSAFTIASTALPSTTMAFYVLLGGFLGILPDVVEGPYFFLNMKSKAIERWLKFQKSIQFDVPPLPGIATQVITIIAALSWLTS